MVGCREPPPACPLASAARCGGRQRRVPRHGGRRCCRDRSDLRLSGPATGCRHPHEWVRAAPPPNAVPATFAATRVRGLLSNDAVRAGAVGVSATGMLVRGDLRRRWRSWVVLGLLAAVTMGVGAAGVAGARRSVSAVPNFLHAWGRIDAAILANDPRFD